jgi:hypothetical protein
LKIEEKKCRRFSLCGTKFAKEGECDRSAEIEMMPRKKED